MFKKLATFFWVTQYKLYSEKHLLSWHKLQVLNTDNLDSFEIDEVSVYLREANKSNRINPPSSNRERLSERGTSRMSLIPEDQNDRCNL